MHHVHTRICTHVHVPIPLYVHPCHCTCTRPAHAPVHVVTVHPPFWQFLAVPWPIRLCLSTRACPDTRLARRVKYTVKTGTRMAINMTILARTRMSKRAFLTFWQNYGQDYKWVELKLTKLEKVVYRHEIHLKCVKLDSFAIFLWLWSRVNNSKISQNTLSKMAGKRSKHA